MDFFVVDVVYTSKTVKFVFNNDGSFQLVVKGFTGDGDLFEPFKMYHITLHTDVTTDLFASLNAKASTKHVYSKLGVVTRETRNSIHIASGKTHWLFPKRLCRLKPGMDVWITVKKKKTGAERRAIEHTDPPKTSGVAP